ncbi:MAG: metallophosphoesterase [Deltaproteobacteria bacterium]|nr:metallophosphoesterase [Deltaproteobacteria bacterium]
MKKNSYKFLFTSDLHGNRYYYDLLLNIVKEERTDYLLFGGDLLPSVSSSNSYFEMLYAQKEFAKEYFIPFVLFLENELPNLNIYYIPGNFDFKFPFFYLKEKNNKRFMELSFRITFIDDNHFLFGYPFVPPTPFRPKDYEKLDDKNRSFPSQKIPSYITKSDKLIPVMPEELLKNNRGTIKDDLFGWHIKTSWEAGIGIFHSPPYETYLDRIDGSIPCGSRAVTEFIIKNQPSITLHGHIHESIAITKRFSQRIGKTLCMNPGQKIFGFHYITFEFPPLDMIELHIVS